MSHFQRAAKAAALIGELANHTRKQPADLLALEEILTALQDDEIGKALEVETEMRKQALVLIRKASEILSNGG